MNNHFDLVKGLLFIWVLGGISDLNAQATKLIGGFVNPTDMVVNGNTMYVSDYKTGKIFKFKLDISNPVLTEVASGFGGPFGMATYNNDLYIAEYDSSQISKIDIGVINPIKQVVWQVQGVSDIECINDTLFAVNFDFNRMEYAVLSSANPSLKNYLSLNGPFRLFIKDSLIYANETSTGKVSWINRDTSHPNVNPFTQSFSNPAGIALYKNRLFIAENSSDLISSIDLLNPTKPKETFVSNLGGPDVIKVYNKTLYIGEFDKGQISTVLLDSSLNNPSLTNSIHVYPNPASNQVSFTGNYHGLDVTVYSMLGERLLSKRIKKGEVLNITLLSSGLYIIKGPWKEAKIFLKL